jgi:hypothetical protein
LKRGQVASAATITGDLSIRHNTATQDNTNITGY